MVASAKSSQKLRIKYVPIDALPPALRNPKSHSPELRKAIRERGFNDPVCINEKTGRLVVGHGRIEALVAMRDASELPPKRIAVQGGKWCVPVVFGVSFETDAEAEAYLLEHNQLTMVTGWEDHALAGMLRDLTTNVEDLNVFGWDDTSLNKLLARESGNFGPAGEDDQGELDQLQPKLVTCPECKHVFDVKAKP